MSEPTISVVRAEAATQALREANARQKASIGRLLEERKAILDAMHAYITTEEVLTFLRENGYDIG